MVKLPRFTWQSSAENPPETAYWFSANDAPAPKAITLIDDTITADKAYQLAIQNHYLLWRSDFHNGRQLLAAIQRRVEKRETHRQKSQPKADSQTPLALFNTHRLQQSQRSQIINRLLVEISPEGVLNLGRAPEVALACQEAFETVDQSVILPLQTLLGIIGAHEWHKKGVFIEALQANIHVPYGVFSPLRGEYLDLVMSATLPNVCNSAMDIGTGSGVIAALLAKRGISHIIATDNSEQALRSARENCTRLGYQDQISFVNTDLFTEADRADLIVVNPPWLPAKPTSKIEHSLYDPNSAMLKAFFQRAPQSLNPDGEVWLILSDLAVHLGLREPNFLTELFTQHRFEVIEQLTTTPTHKKVEDTRDPLHNARCQEITSLYRLKIMAN